MQKVLNVLSGLAAGVGWLWSKGCLGKAAVILGGLFVLGLCGSMVGGGNRASTTAVTPTAPAQAAIVAPAATEQPTEALRATETPEPTATEEPSATPEPTIAPTQAPKPKLTAAPVVAKPTQAPAPKPNPTAAPKPATDPSGVAPASVTDCPPNYPVKGNNGKNGKIYHVPGDRSYKATHPERCFATAADAAAAGYRAPKN